MNTPAPTYTPRLDMMAFIIIAVSFAVRYWFVDSGQLNLVQDEAQYWDWIRRPQLSYYSKGPLVAWVIAGWCKVFGNTELGVRFGAVIGMTAIQAALYIGVSRVWREYRAALFVLFVAATMPLLNGLGILMTTDNPLILCWTVAFFALSAATRNRPDHVPGNTSFVIMAVCIALGILGKYMMLAFVGLGVVYAVTLQMRGQMPPKFWGRFILAAIIGTAIGMLPIILWNMQNDWVAYKHVAKLSSGISANADKPFELRIGPFFEMLGAQIGVMAPWWFVFIMVGSWAALKKSVIGPIGAFDEKYRHQLQTMLFFLPLWLAITLWALKSHTEANWTAVSFIGAAILGGMTLHLWWESPKRTRRGQLILAGTATLLTLFIFISPLLPIPDSLNPTHRLKGWADLGREVHRLRNTEFADSGKVFLMSDRYGITSELAFYAPEQDFAYAAWIDDRRMNQYDLWPTPEDGKIGWDAILVRKKFQPYPAPELNTMFESVSDPILYQTEFNGHPARKFTIILCRGFTGHWPRKGLGKY